MWKRLSHVVAVVLLLATGAGCQSSPPKAEPTTEEEASTTVDIELSEAERTLLETAGAEGSVKVIVQVDTEDETEAVEVLERLRTDLADYDVALGREGETWFSATVTEEALVFLLEYPKVKVFENGVNTTT